MQVLQDITICHGQHEGAPRTEAGQRAGCSGPNGVGGSAGGFSALNIFRMLPLRLYQRFQPDSGECRLSDQDQLPEAKLRRAFEARARRIIK